MNKYSVFDLFSGAGGMAEGFLQAGFDIPFASDKSEQAALTYVHRHKQLGHQVNFYTGDINILCKQPDLDKFLGFSKNKIDVICGGPPCQGFSLAGQRNPLDARNTLVQSYIKILAEVRPKYFVMENVIGILSSKFLHYQGIKATYTNASVVDVLTQEFSNIGYPNVEIKILDASEFGVPQKRQRVIFLGTRSDINIKLTHPVASKNKLKITASNAIGDLEEIANGALETQYLSATQTAYQKKSRAGRTPSAHGKTVRATGLLNQAASRHSDLVLRRFKQLRPGETMRTMLKRLSEEKREALHTKKQNCRRILSDQPSPTVLTLPDDLVHYGKPRILTVREMARLQSFDDSFEFLGKRTTGGDRRKSETPQYSLVGNAVPPLLAYAVAQQVHACLEKIHTHAKQ